MDDGAGSGRDAEAGREVGGPDRLELAVAAVPELLQWAAA